MEAELKQKQITQLKELKKEFLIKQAKHKVKMEQLDLVKAKLDHLKKLIKEQQSEQVRTPLPTTPPPQQTNETSTL